MSKGQISIPAIAAAVFALLGFVISIEVTSSSTLNGASTACSYIDYGALGCGALAMVLGFIAVMLALAVRNTASLAIGAAAAIIGVYHLAAGFGMIGGPCT